VIAINIQTNSQESARLAMNPAKPATEFPLINARAAPTAKST
jgi:hypothetical protein